MQRAHEITLPEVDWLHSLQARESKPLAEGFGSLAVSKYGRQEGSCVCPVLPPHLPWIRGSPEKGQGQRQNQSYAPEQPRLLKISQPSLSQH
jgi:hypothetical protein